MFDIWNQRVLLAEKAYHLDNYIIEYNNNAADNNECVICFSSNNIWFPNTKEVFRKSIFEKTGMNGTEILNGLGKNTYLGDIYKSWYV